MNLGKLKLSGGANVAKPAAPAVSESTSDSKPSTELVQQPTPKAPGIKLGGLKLGGAPRPVAPANATGGGVPDSSNAVAIREPDILASDVPPVAKDSPEGFQAMLDKLDGLIIAGEGVNPLTLDTCRHYVADIYNELRANPNLDPIFKDRDMHNVMMVVQRSTIQATKVIQEKKATSEKRAAKKSATNIDWGFSDFGDVNKDATTPAQVAIAKAKSDSFGLGALDTDGIAAQISAARKGK